MDYGIKLKNMISSSKVAYRIGFYSAMDPNTTSAYSDMARWGLAGCTDGKVINGFVRGYSCAIRRLQEMGKLAPVEYVFENPEHAKLFA